MGFLSRRKSKSSKLREVPGHDDLIMISDEDLEPVINGLTSIVAEGMTDFPFDDETLGLLQAGLPFLTQRDCSDQAILAGQTAARLGYLAGSAEFAKFHAAREADLDLAQALEERIGQAEEGKATRESWRSSRLRWCAARTLIPRLTRAGRVGRSPAWAVRCAERYVTTLLAGMQPPADVTSSDLKRVWKYGYFLRGLEEFFFEEGTQH